MRDKLLFSNLFDEKIEVEEDKKFYQIHTVS